eukprot:TRINITY_DN11989_c0_g1_i1.p1 TRINITY_DN11989_c0_g1~~TRINITY_DN11989_c0_g1_i1.p1  ORF type:complete len:216 (+),score=18.97 TRINITY_DN11989_c0_g1_i1:25-648(+)
MTKSSTNARFATKIEQLAIKSRQLLAQLPRKSHVELQLIDPPRSFDPMPESHHYVLDDRLGFQAVDGNREQLTFGYYEQFDIAGRLPPPEEKNYFRCTVVQDKMLPAAKFQAKTRKNYAGLPEQLSLTSHMHTGYKDPSGTRWRRDIARRDQAAHLTFQSKAPRYRHGTHGTVFQSVKYFAEDASARRSSSSLPRASVDVRSPYPTW